MGKVSMTRITTAILVLSIVTKLASASELVMPSFHGISIYSEDGGKTSSIRVVIDETELLDSFAYWKDAHGIRNEATETDFRLHLYSDAALFALYGGVAPSLHGNATRFHGSPIKVVGEIVEANQYGHSVHHQMFSFTFTKSLDSKIDWDGFDAMSFQTIAPDFHYTPWFEGKLRSEPFKHD